MGTIKSGILGGFSGKVGGVVGTSWKGISVMKAMPQSVANPRTNLQVAQRNAMTAAVQVSGVLLSNYIKPLWDRFAQQMSGYNAFVQANMQCFSDTGFSSPESLILSRGKMAATEFSVTAISAAIGVVSATFSTSIADSYQQATDLCYFACYSETSQQWALASASATRSAGAFTVTFKDALTVGEAVYCFMSFRRADGTVVSDSFYLKENVVA